MDPLPHILDEPTSWFDQPLVSSQPVLSYPHPTLACGVTSSLVSFMSIGRPTVLHICLPHHLPAFSSAHPLASPCTEGRVLVRDGGWAETRVGARACNSRSTTASRLNLAAMSRFCHLDMLRGAAV